MLLPSKFTSRSATVTASLILICNIIYHTANLVPVKAQDAKPETEDFEKLGLHYGKYLKEVVAALDEDQKFTETIKNMNADDIKSGKVAEQLKHVHHEVRKKLNDLKYLEIKRLKDLATRKNEIEQYGETYHGTDKRKWRTLGASLSQLPEHLGSRESYFDVNDLHKLMVAATNDLEKLDKERKEDYKTYEMEKEWQFQERLKMMNETEKAEAIRLRKELKEKHDNHPKVHEPGTKSQFEEVWEKKDNLPVQEFDPRTFFSLHDVNSDQNWDQMEVRQLLTTEVQKLYDPSNPEDDPNEMEEEFERMREHIYKDIDVDKDGLISLQEFLDYSKKPQFKQDRGWEDNGKREAYSRQDYEDYQKNREQYLRNSHGHYDPMYYANQPQNLHLPNWGLGMPAGVHPSQYYHYNVDPNHPQAQQILAAQQQQQHMAYQQQAAYHQQAAAGFQQPQQQYAQQAPVVQQAGNIAPQQAYQPLPQVAPQQVAYNQQPQTVHQQQPQQNIPQAMPQQHNIPQVVPQQPPVQATYQQQPVPIQQQPQQPPPQQQQQPPPQVQQQPPPQVQQQPLPQQQQQPPPQQQQQQQPAPQQQQQAPPR